MTFNDIMERERCEYCEYWYGVKDGDHRLVALYRRHYSSNGAVPIRSQLRHGVSGVGESLCMITLDCKAAFIWVHNTTERYDGETGVQCSFFRNESTVLSSELIREACEIAWRKWPGERLWTYVNPSKIKSTNPGACFLKAGWRKCGQSKGGLVILEALAHSIEMIEPRSNVLLQATEGMAEGGNPK